MVSHPHLRREQFRQPPAQAGPAASAEASPGGPRPVDAFGFEETAVYGEGERVDHAQLSWPEGGGIMLGSVKPDAQADAWQLLPGSFGAYVVVAEPDALYARAKAAGAEITSELRETDYGSRDFIARDPEGNRWSFGTYRGEPRKSGGVST